MRTSVIGQGTWTENSMHPQLIDGRRRRVRRGVTRTVLVGHRWAVKVPCRQIHWGVRGWLANQYEWRHRHDREVNGPVFSFLHLVMVFRAADEVHHFGFAGPWDGRPGDESKPCNWGRFGDHWLLLDFDECHEDRRGLIARLYWWRRDREGRRWMALAAAQKAQADES